MRDLRRRRRRLSPSQDRADAQQKLARLERLGEKIVDAVFEPCDPVFGFGSRRQHEDWHAAAVGRVGAQSRREIEPVLARHHHVENDEIE